MSEISLEQMAAMRPFWPVLAAMITTGTVPTDKARQILTNNQEFAEWFHGQGHTIPRDPVVKPPQLLIQMSLYDALNEVRAKNLSPEKLAEHVIRYMASYLACNAAISAVLKMLSAVDGPSQLEECQAMVQAVLDKQEGA